MYKIKTLFISLLLVTISFSFIGCSGGEADYAFEDIEGVSSIKFLSRSSFIVEKSATPLVDLEVQSTNAVQLTVISGDDRFNIDNNMDCLVYAEGITGVNITEQFYTVIVQAQDTYGKSVNQIITLEFVDDIDKVKPSIDHNLYNKNPFVVKGDIQPFTTIHVYDVRGYGVIYSLIGNDASKFNISILGALSLKSNTPIGQYDVKVVVTDKNNGSLTSETENIHIEVVGSEADLKPTIISTSFSYIENDVNSIQIDAATTTGEAMAFSLGDVGDSDKFMIATTGALTFKTAPDYENPIDNDRDNSYEVDVIVIDVNGNSDQKAIVINILNIDDGIPGFGYTSLEYWNTSIFGDSWKSTSKSLTSLNEDTDYRITLVSKPQVVGDQVTYRLINNSNSSVFILNGAILNMNMPNIDRRDTYYGSVDIVAEDQHGNTQVMSISVEAD